MSRQERNQPTKLAIGTACRNVRSPAEGGGWLTREETSLVVWYIQAKPQKPKLTIVRAMQRPTLRITRRSSGMIEDHGANAGELVVERPREGDRGVAVAQVRGLLHEVEAAGGDDVARVGEVGGDRVDVGVARADDERGAGGVLREVLDLVVGTRVDDERVRLGAERGAGLDRR